MLEAKYMHDLRLSAGLLFRQKYVDQHYLRRSYVQNHITFQPG